jgi:hypothetical protein
MRVRIGQNLEINSLIAHRLLISRGGSAVRGFFNFGPDTSLSSLRFTPSPRPPRVLLPPERPRPRPIRLKTSVLGSKCWRWVVHPGVWLETGLLSRTHWRCVVNARVWFETSALGLVLRRLVVVGFPTAVSRWFRVVPGIVSSPSRRSPRRNKVEGESVIARKKYAICMFVNLIHFEVSDSSNGGKSRHGRSMTLQPAIRGLWVADRATKRSKPSTALSFA